MNKKILVVVMIIMSIFVISYVLFAISQQQNIIEEKKISDMLSNVSEKGEKQVQCSFAKIDANKNDLTYNFSSKPAIINMAVYNAGNTDLYNFTFNVLTNINNFYTFLPENQKTENNPLRKNEAYKFIADNDNLLTGEKIINVKIVANCNGYKVSENIVIS